MKRGIGCKTSQNTVKWNRMVFFRNRNRKSCDDDVILIRKKTYLYRKKKFKGTLKLNKKNQIQVHTHTPLTTRTNESMRGKKTAHPEKNHVTGKMHLSSPMNE